VLEIIFSNNAQLENFKLKIKPSLLTYLNKEVGYTQLDIKERISETDQEKKSKHLSDIDKIKHLSEKNPAFQKFRQEFNLDFE
jgi:hypothetical protein